MPITQVIDSDSGMTEVIQRHLMALDGSRAKFIDYMPSHAAVVLSISSVHEHVPSVFLDCMICTSIQVAPAWEPTKLRIDLTPNSLSGLVLSDGQKIKLECRSIRMVENARTDLWYYSPNAHFSFFDLLNFYRSFHRAPQGRESFSSMCVFLDGYNAALECQGYSLRASGPSVYEFQDWLKIRLGYSKSTCGWRYAITESFPDDKVAYGQFFRLVDEFLCNGWPGDTRVC